MHVDSSSIGVGIQAMHSIIEPRLKEIFHISTSTPRYIGLLELVPSEFVGCPAKLAILTEHLCPEMAGAFRMMNRHLPPWRRVESMLRKWDLAPLSSKVGKFHCCLCFW